MTSNSKGGVVTHMAHEMRAFDALPRQLRDMLNDAPRKICATETMAMMAEDGLTADETLDAVRNVIRRGRP